MSNVQTAVTAIRAMNNDELNQVIEAIKLQRTWLARQQTATLAVGDTVKFQGRGGRKVVGTVTKINRKTVIVKDGYTNWRVTASLLTRVESQEA